MRLVALAWCGLTWSVAVDGSGEVWAGSLQWNGPERSGMARLVAAVGSDSGWRGQLQRREMAGCGLLKGVPPQAIAQGDDSLRGLSISLLCLLCHCVWLVFTNHPAHIRQSLESGNRELTIRL